MIDINKINEAILLTQQGEIVEAELIYHNLLEAEPENALLLSAVGLFYININQYEKASAYLKKACSIQESLGTVSALGFSEFEQANYENSAKILEHALIYGENPDIYNKLILSLFQIKDYKKAINYSAIMHEKYPQDMNAISNMIKSLTYSGKLLEAEQLCIKYLKENQDSAILWYHLGLLKEVIYSDNKQACDCYKMALDLGNRDALYNIAVSYQKQRDYKKAEEYYEKMLEYRPNCTDTKTSLAMCYLIQKKFKEGYEKFFLRKNSYLEKLSNNFWEPDKNFEKEIVVISDQGFGDNIQFARYLPMLKEKVDKIFFAVREPLKRLFKNNYPEIEFINYEEINPNLQAIRVTDLAYALDIDFDNIPFSEGYLKSIKKEIISEKIKVGLCWEAGSAGIRTMLNRTINIKLLEPIFNMENVELYSFQVNDTLKGNELYPQIINLAKDFKDFEDTAQALLAMDVVITVDTSVAHLAGALGVKTFLLLPYTSDWRWFDDEKITPWYTSVEIFKQNDVISWEKPIEDIICRLKNFSL